ncbi:MAG: DUF6717 family protein [Tepidisphaeraceae bacterium]|jgi:hypothetical protein
MTQIELYMLAGAAVGLVIWLRGCIRGQVADCAVGLFIAALASAGYFILFSLTRTPFLGSLIFVPFLLLLPFGRLRRNPAGRFLGPAVLLCAAISAGVEYKLVSAGNALLVIEPYRSGSVWRFDEPALHLKGEPFVQGIPAMIDKMVAGIPGSDKSVRLIFSQRPFPGSQFRLDLRREQDGGNWYYNEQFNMEGWLCPALFKFFPRAPRHIYVRAEAK